MYKPHIKIGHHVYQEHAVYEQYAFDYESAGPAEHHITAI